MERKVSWYHLTERKRARSSPFIRKAGFFLQRSQAITSDRRNTHLNRARMNMNGIVRAERGRGDERGFNSMKSMVVADGVHSEPAVSHTGALSSTCPDNARPRNIILVAVWRATKASVSMRRKSRIAYLACYFMLQEPALPAI